MIANTQFDEEQHICNLVDEIIKLTKLVDPNLVHTETYLDLIREKAKYIKRKAQKMENRLKEYKIGIEELGFKRIRSK